MTQTDDDDLLRHSWKALVRVRTEPPATALIRYDSMCRAIAEAYEVDEAKEIRDRVVALETYARQAHNLDLERQCREIRLRAERKAGELLSVMDKATGTAGLGRPSLGGSGPRPPNSDATTLADLGISKDQSSHWQQLATVPEAKFEAALAALAMPTLNGILRANRDPAALCPTPARDGPDFYATVDQDLITALVRHVLPLLPTRRIWECAAGQGHLVDPLRHAGCEVVATDRYPDRQDITKCDFLVDVPPDDAVDAVVLTNPPYNQLDEFIARGLELLDSGFFSGLVLLLRLDHLQASERVDAFNRTTFEIHCNWRTEWVEGTGKVGRWSSHWIGWLNQPRQATLYLRPECA